MLPRHVGVDFPWARLEAPGRSPATQGRILGVLSHQLFGPGFDDPVEGTVDPEVHDAVRLQLPTQEASRFFQGQMITLCRSQKSKAHCRRGSTLAHARGKLQSRNG